MINPTEITSQLEGLQSKIFTPSLLGNLDKSIKEFESLNVELVGRVAPSLNDVAKKLEAATPRLASLSSDLKSKLPRVGEEINAGIKGMSSVLNDFPKDAPIEVPKAMKAATTVVGNLQLQVPGIQKGFSELAGSLPSAMNTVEKLVPQLNAAQNTVANAITGTTVSAKFNNAVLALPSPAAISEAVDAVSKATKSVIPDVQLVVSAEIQTHLTSAVGGIKGDLGGLTSGLSGALSAIKTDFTIPNLNNIVNDALSGIGGDLLKNFGDVLPKITGSPLLDAMHQMAGTVAVVNTTLGLSSAIPSNITNSVINGLTNGTVGSTLDLLKNTPNLGIDINIDIGGIESKLQGLQDKFGSVASLLGVGGDISSIISTNLVSGVENLAKSLPVVSNLEETSAEILSSLNQPTAMEVSWTETYKDDLVTKDTIIPKDYYHYIILQDGTIQRSKALGNDSTIRVAVVGGYNVFRGEFGVLTPDSITMEQVKAAKSLFQQTISTLPGISIFGAGKVAAESVKGGEGNPIEPGIDIAALLNSIDGRSEVVPNGLQAEPNPTDQGMPIGPRVVYLNGTDWFRTNPIRNRLIQPQLMKIINQAAEDANLYVTIFSGGQMPRAEVLSKGGKKNGESWYIPGQKKAVATGSTRHDNGWAADIWIYTDSTRNNRLVPGVNINPPAQAERFIRALKANGATAVGVGPNYMGNTGIHVDIAYGRAAGAGAGKYWAKAGATAPTWLGTIMA